MAKYHIESVVEGPETKFCAMVSFNGGAAHYHEIEVPNDLGMEEKLDKKGNVVLDKNGEPVMVKVPLPKLDGEYVNAMLTKAAEELEVHEEAMEKSTKAVKKIKIVDGKVSF